MSADLQNILVIKLSALGDFVQNLGLMRAIRQHHPDAKITLLTTKPFVDLAKKSKYFDEIWIDPRPKFYQIKQWILLRNKLNAVKFTYVYDLQINDRTALYHSLLKVKPHWIGAIKKEDRTKSGFAFDRHKHMLEAVGLEDIQIDTMDWMKTDISHLPLNDLYALIVPGCAPTRPEKRWPAALYASVCKELHEKNIQPVLIGTKDEEDVLQDITKLAPETLNLGGQTSLFDIVTLARGATYAIGNDTGPMHMIAPTGCKTLTIFSKFSDPLRHAPLGQSTKTLQADNIEDIKPAQVIDALETL